MFRVDDSRKRIRKRPLDPHLQAAPSSSRRRLSVGSSAPLRGVVVCLTGLTADEKNLLHRQVEKLGGRYSRDLDTSLTTHLIAQVPEGAKYEAAAACPNIQVVSPDWLDASIRSGTRADEGKFSWIDDAGGAHHAATDGQDDVDVSGILTTLLDENERNELFASCRFVLIGFHDEEKHQLSKLIRRGMGTIYWELNEMITHLIVETNCDDEWRDTARAVSMHHPNSPASISPSWVVSSWKSNRLLSSSQFPPRKTIMKQMPVSEAVNKAKAEPKASKSSDLFRGHVFALMRLAPPPASVDYDAAELERLILQHGGQMLSTKLVEALKADRARSADSTQRKCYVLWWGGYDPSHVPMHLLLSQTQRLELCTIVHANPVWLEACITDQRLTTPSRRPLLFEPHPYPTRRLPDSLSSNAKDDGIKIAVTGFVGSERMGTIYLLRSIGATYTENMRSSNTHLICKEARGPKFDKAVEWGLHVVSLDWLIHIARYGYGGTGGSVEVGCERRFSLSEEGDTALETMADIPTRLEKRMQVQEQHFQTSQLAASTDRTAELQVTQEEVPGTEPQV